MSDILELIKRKFFLIGAISMLVTGALYITLGDGEGMFMISGAIMLVLGLVLLISGYITPIVSESNTGLGIGFFMLLGSIIGIVGIISLGTDSDAAYAMLIAGPVITLLMFIAWPCVCCSGSRAIRGQIIGVASAHDSITISELSNITGAPIKLTSEIVYDAIGKRELQGRMEGDRFVRSSGATPSSYSAPSTTTREREVVKVLVICPYCGAKTEQGLSKCQNCQADL